MSKEIYISSTPHETRLAIVENDDLTEIYYERENEYTLAGSIYNGKVTRVLPGMQSSFVDVGLERDAFLYITDFVEEAGDSAEFDSADGASGSRRSSASREDRSGRGEDRAAREQSNAPADEANGNANSSANGSKERLAAPATAEVRNDRGGERGGGRRRRGGNPEGRNSSREGRGENLESRGGNRDRSGDPRTSSAPPPPPAELSFDIAPAVHSGYVEPGADSPGGELGEGAPGADGSRRWRGRRGRRRGRSSAQREESQALQQPRSTTDGLNPSPESSLGRGYQADSSNAEDLEENFDREYDGSFDLDASAVTAEAAMAPPLEAVPPAPAFADDPTRRDRNDVGDRNERGDRSDRGRRDRGGRDSRPPRAPRGFAPARSLYGLDSPQEAEISSDASAGGEPVPEPMILPGESLSKYRKDDERQGSSTATMRSAAALPPPPVEFTLPAQWDGGSVLPGETIRPRSNAGSAGASLDQSGPDRIGEGRGSRDRRDDIRNRDDRGGRGGGRPDRNDRGGRGERGDRDRSSSRNTPAPTASSRDESIQPGGTLSSFTPAPLPTFAINAAAAPLVGASQGEGSTIEQTSGSKVPEFTSSEAASGEYEPSEASASVRFDPATRREFRQSPPVAEIAGSFAPEPEAGESDPAHVEDPLLASPEVTQSIAHSITPEPGATMAPIRFEAPDEAPASHASTFHEEVAPFAATTSFAPAQPFGSAYDLPTAGLVPHQSVPEHEFTSVSDTGEMLLDAPAPPQSEIAEPSSPLHHESAILDAVAPPDSPMQGSSESFDDLPSAPLDQEELFEEEEDFKATTLHASSIEEMDYEEETLEGAADLGTMIREMSIDQITRTGQDADEDEDILEEEDAIDDHLGSSYEASDEDDEAEHPRILSESAGTRDGEEFAGSSSVERAYGSDPSSSTESPGLGGEATRDSDRRSSRRDGGGRRDGRGRDRDRGGDRARSTGGSGDRSTSRPGRRDGRHSAQTTNLPAISDLLKPGQEVLVQIAKEPIAKKGARITSHIALPGRFLVFMPTVNHTGVSRKIESDGERRRLKEILLSEKGEATGGFIVRTAASGASEEELRSDLRFLLNLWADIKQRSESSKSPALIYHDLNLVERILRDQVTDTFSAIWVDTETEYERVLRFLQRFQPSLIRRVKLYSKETPLFEQFGITEEINKALRSKVWLKSGGSIVINQTEALVAIDINTGKYVGKTARLEDTIVKTNLDAIPEIVRQIRLRDLGGIIIIDFIDMDERKNRAKVMTALEDELKKDRAPSKVLQFNDFGLVAITRKRVKQSLERTLSATCNVCQGTGMTKSPVTVCNDIYIEMRKMQKHLDRGDVMLRVNPEVVKQLKATGTRWLQEMEEMVGKTILVKSDPSLHPEQFDIH